MKKKTVTVDVKKDHLETLTKANGPYPGIAELIWNALDADASSVRLDFQRNSMDGISLIRISDDGVGIPKDLGEKTFGSLGGSWKGTAYRTEAGRVLHGKFGKGRYKAFSLGLRVAWETTYQNGGKCETYRIIGSYNSLKNFDFEEIPSANRNQTGTIVEVTEILKPFPVLNDDDAGNKLSLSFAPYLMQYPGISILINGRSLNYRAGIIEIKSIPLPDINTQEGVYPIEGTLIEWGFPTERTTFFCDQNGFTLLDRPLTIQCPGFSFSLYLKSEYFKLLNAKGSLEIGEMEKCVIETLDHAKKEIRKHFLEKAAKNSATLVDDWKKEDIYPYTGQPKTVAEEVERKVFDVVALNVNEYLPDFGATEKKSKKLTFHLLKTALQECPKSLQKIFDEVLRLSKDKQEELAELIKRTTFESIISAAYLVANRLDFLAALRAILFEKSSKKKLKERSELHKIVEHEPWIFGEEYHLACSDKDLNEVLRRHLKDFKIEMTDNTPVEIKGKKRGIVDLMFACASFPSSERRTHLIVELKRPSVKIGEAAIAQTKKYANAIAADDRFKHTETNWEFWIVSNDFDAFGLSESTQENRPKGLIYHANNIRIWGVTWGEIVQKNQARLSYIQKELKYNSDMASGLDYLNRVHEKYLSPETKQALDEIQGRNGTGDTN